MNETIDFTDYLQTIAAEVVGLTSKPEGLRAILLTGSISKGIADEYSDIELKLI